VKKRPNNIVIFQTDQLAAPALSLYGGIAKTPCLDAIAKDGVVFENAYCNYPLCAPSRFSMMSGQLPSAIGAYDNAAEFPASVPTFAHYLRRAGYRTCLSGKMHFIGPDQLHGFEERLTTEIYPADFAWLPDWESRQQSFAPIRNTIESAGVCAWNLQLAFDEDATFQAIRKIYEYARDPEQPFCLVVSLTHPHPPFLITPEYWELYTEEEIPRPKVGRLAEEDLDAHSRRVRDVIGLRDSDVDGEQASAARHAYYAAISYFDDNVAQVMAALERSEMADDTAIFVVGDHGEMLGERGLWAKDSFFEWSMRVPFLVKFPGESLGYRRTENVSLVDLMPTVLGLAGIDAQEQTTQLAGNDLTGLIRGQEKNWPNQVLAEYSAEAAAAPMVMIRKGRYKYIQAAGDPQLLYDLETDPDELLNLAEDSEYAAVCADFTEEVNRHWDLATLDTDIRRSQRQRALVGAALAVGKQTSWDYQPQPDYSQTYIRDAVGAVITDRKVRVAAKGYKLPGS
jgi:choline-sulfatase